MATDEGDRVFRAHRGIVLNPGTEPAIPSIEGLDGTSFWTNRDAVRAREVPRSLIVLGAGPVGMEFAQVFARFGSDTALVETAPRLLPNDEPEAAESLTEVFTSEGITVHTGSAARRVTYHDGQFTVELDSGAGLRRNSCSLPPGRRIDEVPLSLLRSMIFAYPTFHRAIEPALEDLGR